MPEQSNDDGLVPPVKVLRKRLNGVYRADGLSGPTRRYVLIVALLVGLASLPTLAAITAGTNEIDDGSTGAMDVPFLPPPSTGPVIPVPVSPSPDPGRLHGQAGNRKIKPGSSYEHRTATATTGGGHSRWRSPGSRPAWWNAGSRDSSRAPGAGAPAHLRHPGASGSDAASPGSSGSGSPGSVGDGSPSGDGSPGSDGASGAGPGDGPESPSEPADGTPPGHPVPPPGRPTDPSDEPAEHLPTPPSGLPFCHERGECGSGESRHHRPDWSRHGHCEDGHDPGAGHRDADRWTRDDGEAERSSDTDAEDERSSDTDEDGERSSDTDEDGERPSDTDEDGGRSIDSDADQPEPTARSIVSHRSSDRSEPSRRSTVSERPPNARPARFLERTHNSRRYHADGWDDTEAAVSGYRGSHRADRMHADGTRTAADNRSSRVGRHHADQSPDDADGW